MKIPQNIAHPSLLRCHGLVIIHRKRIAFFCQRHGTRIYSARKRRGYTLDTFMKEAALTIKRHISDLNPNPNPEGKIEIPEDPEDMREHIRNSQSFALKALASESLQTQSQ